MVCDMKIQMKQNMTSGLVGIVMTSTFAHWVMNYVTDQFHTQLGGSLTTENSWASLGRWDFHSCWVPRS